MSRTANSAKNILTKYVSQFLLIVLNFVTRTVFIRTLGEAYLGINGLFTNILSMLSLAELGVGTAIVFKLYKPIEEHNEARILALMDLYRKIYFIIGCVIVVLGMVIAPFLRYIIRDYDRFAQLHLNPIFLFTLYVFKSAFSYWFFAYKQSLVRAHQKTYLLTVRSYAVSIASCLTQIAVLFFTRNFVLYTITLLAFSVLENLILARVADRQYPYLKKKALERVGKEEIKGILKDCSALFLYKVNNAVITATDTIILSSTLGLLTVGLYSNYSMIAFNIRNLLYSLYESLLASIGSIHATGNHIWKRNLFRTVNFATFLIYGVVSIGFALLCDEFITLWVGNEFLIAGFDNGKTILRYSLPLVFAAEIYSLGIANFLSSFRSAFGLFRQLKFRPLFTMFANLIVGITLTPVIGVAAPVLGTVVAMLITDIVDPIVIINAELDLSKTRYFITNLGYLLATVAAGIAAYFLCRLVPFIGILGFIVRGFVCVFVTVAVYLLLYLRSEEMRMLLSFLPEKLKRKLPEFLKMK